MNYLCHRCGYETNFKSNMKSHLDKLIKCTKNINSIGKSDHELYKLSLQPNKNKLNNTFNCTKCGKNYSRIDSFNRHLKKNKECSIEYKADTTIKECNINNNLSVGNATHSNITCGDNINNKINIYILPFDDYWTTEHLKNKDKSYIVTSIMKYTTLLTELLENDENLNVIVEENTNEALIFKNKEEKYINIKKKDLYSKTMQKLKNILIEMTNNIITSNGHETNFSNTLKKHLQNEIEGIIKKYEDYEENNDIRNNANISLEKVFINKKNDAEIIAQKIIEDEGY